MGRLDDLKERKIFSSTDVSIISTFILCLIFIFFLHFVTTLHNSVGSIQIATEKATINLQSINNIQIPAQVVFYGNTTSNNPKIGAVVTPKETPVLQISFSGADKDSIKNLRIEDVPKTIPKLDEKHAWVQLYAIDSTAVNFTNATVNVVAKGTNLYKCKSWNFDNQSCSGTWVLFKTGLVPGQKYEFELSHDDPAFAEIIVAIDAQHLDENYTFISDIYPEIEAIDNNWSEPIYENQYVRVTYAENLTSSNFIDYVARSNTSAYFDVYIAGTDQKVGTSDIVSGSQQYINMSGLNQPEDTFDFKIQDPNESDANPFIQFDYIHDQAPNNLTANSGIYFDGFETGTLVTDGWTVSSGWERNITAPYAGTYDVRDNTTVTTAAYLYLNMSTAYYQNINISFYANTTGTSVTKYMAEWWNGSVWGVLMNTTHLATYTYYNYLLTANNSNNNANFRLMFNCTVSATAGRGCYLDNVNISGTTMDPNITGVMNYSVTNQSVMINWTTYLNSNTTLRYGNQSSNLLRFNISVNDNGAVHNVSVSGLMNGTIYFYNVTSCTPAGACNTSGIYNFTTLPYNIPQVFAVLPVNGSIFNTSNIITIQANVTGPLPVNTVYTNITLSNKSITQLTLPEYGTSPQYNATYTAPNLLGTYNVTFIANDTLNNINNTIKTNFTVNDIIPPAVFSVLPINGTIFNISNVITIQANVTDNINVSTVYTNITLSNKSITQLTLPEYGTSPQYNATYTIPALSGQYNVTFIGNDSSGNVNSSITTYFTVASSISITILSVNATPNPVLPSQLVNITANVTDGVTIDTVWFNLNLINITMKGCGTGIYCNDTINVSSLYAGIYSYTVYANDTSSNTATPMTSNFTISAVVSVNLYNQSINFSSGQVGQTLNAQPLYGFPMVVQNTGNINISVNISGTNLSGATSARITPNYVDWSNASGFTSLANLSYAQQLVNPLMMQLQTTNIFFRINVPLGIPSQQYTGNITIVAESK